MMHRASVRVEGMPELSGVLSPEMEDGMERSSMSIRDGSGATVIEIEAEDSTALRASLSSVLRYLSAAYSAIDAIEKEE